MTTKEAIKAVRRQIEIEKRDVDYLNRSILDLKYAYKKTKERRFAAKKARAIIQKVAKDTLSNLQYHISGIVSMALNAVNPDFPSFVSEIEIKREHIEWNMYFDVGGKKVHPFESDAGGACDVSAFALRIIYWSLKKNRATFILDEPFKNVSPSFQGNVSEMLKMLSVEKGIQFIMISHADDVNKAADRTFFLEKKNKKSSIKHTS